MSCNSCNSKSKSKSKRISKQDVNFNPAYVDTPFQKIVFFIVTIFLLFTFNWYLNIPILELVIAYVLFNALFSEYIVKNKKVDEETSD